MLSKEDLIKRLREHPLYQKALASVDPEQAKRIASVTEGFLGQAAEGLVPLIVQATDPVQLTEVQRVLREDGRVIRNDPVVTGSKDG